MIRAAAVLIACAAVAACQTTIQPGCYSIATGPSGATYTAIACPPPPPSTNFQPPPTGLPPLPSSYVLPAPPVGIPAVPTLPRVASVVQVSTAAQFNAALSTAMCGQAIVMQSGVTITNPATSQGTTSVVIPAVKAAGGGNCPPDEPLVIANSQDWESYPSGQRIAPTSPALFWILTSNSSPAVKVANGAANVYLEGFGVGTITPMPANIYPLFDMGDNDATDISMIPTGIVQDRIAIVPPMAQPGGPYVQRGESWNCRSCVVMNSYCDNVVNGGADTQCYEVDNTDGKGLYLNNYTRASGENMMFATKCNATVCGPAANNGNPNGVMPAPVPCDYGIYKSDFEKSMAWTTAAYDVKDVFEVKNGCRLDIQANVFAHTFAGAQAECVILNAFKGGPFVVQDITIQNNLLVSCPSGIQVNGNGLSSTVSGITYGPTIKNVLIRNNYGVDIDGRLAAVGVLPGQGIGVSAGNCTNCIVDHNTFLNFPPTNTWSFILDTKDVGLVLTNDIAYGDLAAGSSVGGAVTVQMPTAIWGGDYLVGAVWPKNTTLSADHAPPYPAGITTVSSTATPVVNPKLDGPCNYYGWWPLPTGTPEIAKSTFMADCFPLDWPMIQMVDWQGAFNGTSLVGGQLAPTSPYRCKATDSTAVNCVDPGANISDVLAAVSGVVQ